LKCLSDLSAAFADSAKRIIPRQVSSGWIGPRYVGIVVRNYGIGRRRFDYDVIYVDRIMDSIPIEKVRI